MSPDFFASHVNNIFTRKYILRRERVYGHGWLSVGGELTTRGLCHNLRLKPGQRVLDFGSGIGAAAFFFARQYAVNVIGVDLSTTMISIANERLQKQDEDIIARVKFEQGNLTDFKFEPCSFDAMHSREVFVYNKDKETITTKLYTWLKDEGNIAITDLCLGDTEAPSTEFKDYVAHFDYHMLRIDEFRELLEKAGFRDVQTVDKGKEFIEIMQRELDHFLPCKEAFVLDFSEEEFDGLVHRWQRKIAQTQAKELTWVMINAKK